MTDYYKVLGIKRDASGSEVKSAFRKLALKFHPDRHATSSEHHKKDASRQFRELLEAYEVLSDEKKRRLYNREGRVGTDYQRRYGAQTGYGRPAGGASTGAYEQGPFGETVHPTGRGRSPFQMRWRFSLGFSRADYLFHGLIAIVAVVGFTTASTFADSLWKIRNTGKSFEETMEAVELRKQARQPDKNSKTSS